MFAFAPLIWLYAVGAEVFSVNNFFAALIVWQTVRVAKLRRHRDVCLGALLCGLATCNQHTIILFEAPLIVFLLWSFRSVRDAAFLLLCRMCSCSWRRQDITRPRAVSHGAVVLHHAARRRR